jgi:hypothetical protein
MKKLFKDIKSFFNPFLYIAGWDALFTGLVLMALAAFLGYITNYWQDGLIDLHLGPEGPFWLHLAMTLTNWLLVVIILTPLAFWLSDSKIRFLDLAGTLALARFPIIFAMLPGFSTVPDKLANFMMYTFLGQGEPVEVSPLDITIAIVFGILVILCLIWMVALHYNAYRMSANLSGKKGGISFAAGYVVAYVLSKFATAAMLRYFL